MGLNDGFHHGISDFQAQRMTVREIAMLAFMNSITDKPMWSMKIFDEGIVHKWRAEVQAIPDGMISDKAFEWCVKELRDKAKNFERQSFVPVLDSETRCVKSDVLISEALRNILRQAAQPLMDVRDDEKDWHPNSDSKVLNLVHPSLYPLVSGRSTSVAAGQVGRETCFDFMGRGEVVKPSKDWPDNPFFYHGLGTPRNQDQLCSKRLQWLPSEIEFVGDEGNDVKISSYVNNLHPIKHARLYGILEEIISKSIPLWNNVLVKKVLHKGPNLRIHTDEAITEPKEAPFLDEIWSHGTVSTPASRMASLAPKIKEYLASPDNPQAAARQQNTIDEDDEMDDFDRMDHLIVERFNRTRTVLHPEPGDSKLYEQWYSGHAPQNIEQEFRQHGLQVIVKLSSIELTPEKPDYNGGSWHLEGMLNESIVATSIYYYDIENVTESRIRFSHEAIFDEMNLKYPQDDHDPLAIVFGTESMREEPAVQEFGSIATRNGRVIAFPNTMRHRVEPFSLVDKTKPGHRRYLVLWLVDPHRRIVSTADVPPQQLEWAEGVDVDTSAKESLMSLDEAKAYRLELMKERTMLDVAVEDNFDQYNLCEH